MAPVLPTRQRALELALAALLVVVALAVVLVARVGPVVLTVADGMGVHSGDSFGILAAVGALWLAAPSPAGKSAQVGVSRTPARRRPRVPVALER